MGADGEQGEDNGTEGRREGRGRRGGIPWGLAAAILLLLGLGMALGAGLARLIGPMGGEPAPLAASSSPGPMAGAQEAADAPATETSPQREIEDEPLPPVPPPPPLAMMEPATPPLAEAVPESSPAAPAALPAPPPVEAPPAPQPPALQPPPVVAALTPLPPSALPAKPLPPGHPAWQRYALPAPPAGGRPMIAVILDDMGVDKRRSEQALHLPGPLTMSFMSYAEELPRQTAEARARGHELMMHVPMEPLAAGIDPGPGVLTDRQSLEEVHRTLEDDLNRFTGYVGINNHMGSKFTANGPGMQVVMQSLRHRGLLFIDSLTTERSVGLAAARQAGVPSAGRNVFLDNAGDLMSVQVQLDRTEEIARKKGSAIAIGHPRDATIAALAAWLPGLARKGFVLVPVTTVVKSRMASPPAVHADAGH